MPEPAAAAAAAGALELRQATAAECACARERWHSLWGDGLSLPQLQELEASQDCSGLQPRLHFVLQSPGSSERECSSSFLASCEVLPAPLSLPGGSSSCSWHLACLFVPAACRGRGYATALVNAVAAEAAGRGVSALLLFSDVGAAIYEGMGFLCCAGPAQDVLLSCSGGSSAAGSPPAQLPVLLQRDIPLSSELHSSSSSTVEAALLLRLPCPAGSCVLQLEPRRLAWLAAAEAFRCRAGLQAELSCRGSQLLLPALLPEPAGSESAGTGQQEVVVAQAVWLSDAAAGELSVLALSAQSREQALLLLQRAQAVAAAAGLQGGVRLWLEAGTAAESLQLASLQGAVLQQRKGKLPMLRPLGQLAQGLCWQGIQRGSWY
jgi:GNAT superfamily N-acetyltransferase